MVQSVVGLEPQLDVPGLGDVNVLQQQYVEVIEAGPGRLDACSEDKASRQLNHARRIVSSQELT
jgi:hypothetical protein